jgi:putative ribosome biogenesis GTPase RsgA
MRESIYDMAKRNAPKAKDKIDYWHEIVMTFSNRKSLFSSKKIERFIVFWTFLVLTVVYVIKNIHEMDSIEFIEVVGLWLAFAGYNTFMVHKDTRVNNIEEDKG